jgi:small ubiquitin-related modifier
MAIVSQAQFIPPVDPVSPGTAKKSITLRVSDGSGEVAFFEVKTSTEMSKLFNCYANLKGVCVSALRFVFDGVKVEPTDTAVSHGMQHNDIIEVVNHTHFGSSSKNILTISIRNTDREVTYYKLKASTHMSKLFDNYAKRKGVCARSLDFYYKNVKVEPTNTPTNLDMGPYDEVLVSSVPGIV